MELNIVTQKKVLDLLKTIPINFLEYKFFKNIMSESKTRITHDDMLTYLAKKAEVELEKEHLPIDHFSKLIYSLTLIIK